MTSLASLRTHTDALIAALEAASLTVGDADGPTSTHGWTDGVGDLADFTPYVIVYPLPAGFLDGDLAEHSDHASLAWSAVCVGGTREQAEWVQDVVLSTLVASSLSVAGRSIGKVWADMVGGARRDDTATGAPVFIATPRIRALSYPA